MSKEAIFPLSPAGRAARLLPAITAGPGHGHLQRRPHRGVDLLGPDAGAGRALLLARPRLELRRRRPLVGRAQLHDAAGQTGIPQVIVPGCLDMANFWARDTVPEKYRLRLFYEWNPNVTLMRTTPQENEELGRILAQKANAAAGPVAFFLPKQGVSILDSPGNEFWWPEADQALFDAIKSHVRAGIPVYELDNNINDDAFAQAVTAQLLAFLEEKE